MKHEASKRPTAQRADHLGDRFVIAPSPDLARTLTSAMAPLSATGSSAAARAS